MYKNLICLVIMLGLCSCSYLSVRKPIIEQGNIITSEMISELHTGMSTSEVISVMGEPVLTNLFTPNRMVYVYTYQDGRTRSAKRLNLLFSDGRLESIQTG